ncbi:hypothetical protein PInf_020422 [Phytophthora infestans]|nr:hypothetical protein PInf_020422 [Phytophthora infestans]
MATEMTTTEETETTETVTSEDVRALAREDVSGDVTRSVAERGGYAVSLAVRVGGHGIEQADNRDGTTTEMATEMTTTEETETTETVTSEDVRALAREDWGGHGIEQADNRDVRGDGDVCRGYHYGNGHRDDHDGGNGNDKTVTSEDVRALAREDVSGDVTRSVAERGGDAVSFGCTSGAGTGSSKQTTETSEETETFCRGYHYGNGHRDDHDGRNGNDGDSDERGRESLGTRRREWRRDPQCG